MSEHIEFSSTAEFPRGDNGRFVKRNGAEANATASPAPQPVEDEVTVLLRRLGEIERDYQKFKAERDQIKATLKEELPKRGAEKAVGFGVIVTVAERSRSTLNRALVKAFVGEAQYGKFLEVKSYKECRVELLSK